MANGDDGERRGRQRARDGGEQAGERQP